MFSSESLMTILKTTDALEELLATKEKVELDIARQRSRDSGGDDGNSVIHVMLKLYPVYEKAGSSWRMRMGLFNRCGNQAAA